MNSSQIPCLGPVSIVIVNHNAGSLLTDCVRTGLEQARQVIVVDNASSDSSLSQLEANFPSESRLRVIRSGRNLGFAAGCHTGVQAATESCILFLNPDCILTEGALDRMLKALQSDPRAGMVGGLLTNPDGTEQGGGRRAVPTPWRSFVRAVSLHRFANRWPRLFFDFYLHLQPLPNGPLEVEAISGALMLVRREAIEDVGSWDQGYFLHCEDLDWCMRFRQKGWKILFVPDAPVVHYQGTCSRSRPIFVEWHKHKGMMRFYRKFFYHQYPGILMWLVALGVWGRFGVVAAYYGVLHVRRFLGFGRG
ncbi:MAG: dTDP-Rha--alpha-D-GlcNAc-pyrophosphate polyprenol alpha-3-L-rhamnosyltransferase [Herminiimonas sp.]|nr:dTDP-Rha--alpha-D-GlcNAc-pyrophosphate polyprenol alpha-3-L-rhamnosyltransferase [Herminiimonas sp.]